MVFVAGEFGKPPVSDRIFITAIQRTQNGGIVDI
jgi:hypothetical protein